MCFVNEHLQVFLGIVSRSEALQPWRGMNVRMFAQSVVNDGNNLLQMIPDQEHDRAALRAFCQENDTSDSIASLAVFAWGRMDLRRNAQRAWGTRHEWLPLVKKLRTDANLNRKDAYHLFFNMRNEIEGLGPAYYTKLIFFLGQKRDGYIMDQWAARSVNLLCGREVVRLRRSTVKNKNGMAKDRYYVLPDNSPDAYEEFCSVVDELASMAKVQADFIEQHLMSSGGWNPGSWRQYVLEQAMS